MGNGVDDGMALDWFGGRIGCGEETLHSGIPHGRVSTRDPGFNLFLVFSCVGWFVGLQDGSIAAGNVLTDVG